MTNEELSAHITQLLATLKEVEELEAAIPVEYRVGAPDAPSGEQK